MLFEKKEFHMSVKDTWFIRHEITRKKMTWTSQNGKEQLIKSLDSNHLSNIVAKIERGDHELKKEYIHTLKHEVDYRYLLNAINNQNN